MLMSVRNRNFFGNGGGHINVREARFIIRWLSKFVQENIPSDFHVMSTKPRYFLNKWLYFPFGNPHDMEHFVEVLWEVSREGKLLGS